MARDVLSVILGLFANEMICTCLKQSVIHDKKQRNRIQSKKQRNRLQSKEMSHAGQKGFMYDGLEVGNAQNGIFLYRN
jgi:hypothetical protein